MPLNKFLLNIFKWTFSTYDWFWADGSHIMLILSLNSNVSILPSKTDY